MINSILSYSQNKQLVQWDIEKVSSVPRKINFTQIKSNDQKIYTD
jgi:hypothetical protein